MNTAHGGRMTQLDFSLGRIDSRKAKAALGIESDDELFAPSFHHPLVHRNVGAPGQCKPIHPDGIIGPKTAPKR